MPRTAAEVAGAMGVRFAEVLTNKVTGAIDEFPDASGAQKAAVASLVSANLGWAAHRYVMEDD